MAVALVAAGAAPARADAPARYDKYYYYMDVGPKAIPFADTKWDPQGLTKLGENSLVISYRDTSEDPSPSRLAVISRTSGDQTHWFRLDVKGHVGGIATTSKYLWVANDGKLRRYPRSWLTSKGDGATLTADATFTVNASSYAFGQGETMWVGDFGPWDGIHCPTSTEKMSAVTAGMPMPPGMKFPF